MKRNKIFVIILLSVACFTSCKKQLDVKNPNQPTPDGAATETGIVSLAQGGVYINGFRNLKYGDGVFGAFWSGAMGFHEMMADVIQVEAANAYIQQIGCPEKVTLDNAAVVLNPNSPNQQIPLLRQINVNAQQGQNPTYYEWAYMYSMIAACNSVLDVVENVNFLQEGATKKATIQAWAYWWKGFAYSRIGSMYYAGLINNSAFATNGNYVTKEAVITEAAAQFDKCVTALNAATNAAAYTSVMEKLIPDFFQVGKGNIPTQDMWKRSINTMKARNILVNKTVAAMVASDWSSIVTLVNSGIQSSDNVFTGRSNTNGDFITGTGTVSGKTQSTLAGGNTYKLSERWVQEFRTGDLRKDNNVNQTTTWIGNSDRGNAFNTRFALANGGNGLAGVVVYANNAPGAYELYLAGTWEENELIKAEATMYANSFSATSINTAMGIIDAVRNSHGAGLAPVQGVITTQTAALEELRRERRITLAFRGLSFYDARRWKVIDPVAQGGGRTGGVVLSGSGVVSTNASIVYNFLDYWDVPDNELVYNPPASGSAAIKNPKQ